MATQPQKAKAEDDKTTLSEIAKDAAAETLDQRVQTSPEGEAEPTPAKGDEPTHQLTRPFWDGKFLQPRGKKLRFKEGEAPKSAKAL